MLQNSNKQYSSSLEDRTLEFSKNIISLIKKSNKDLVNLKINDQLIRSATSIGANYREANETLTKKEFKYKIKLCVKESKETVYWLELLEYSTNLKDILPIKNEAIQLLKIFASISLKVDT